MALFAVKDIRPNPFRHIDRYPIHRDKVEALKESYHATGYWGNIVARLNNGGAEIAYGHHRKVALAEEYGPNGKVELIIRDLDDDAMLKIMARENMEEWGTSASVEHETVRAVVEAYGKGLIHLEKPDSRTPATALRYAPSFQQGDLSYASTGHAYTTATVAAFVGWLTDSGGPKMKVSDTLSALEFIEAGLLKDGDFDGLTTTQARALITEARKHRDSMEATARAKQKAADDAKAAAEAAAKRREEQEALHKQREVEAVEAEKRRRTAEAARQEAEETRRAEAEKARKAAADAKAAKDAEAKKKAEAWRKIAEENQRKAEKESEKQRKAAEQAQADQAVAAKRAAKAKEESDKAKSEQHNQERLQRSQQAAVDKQTKETKDEIKAIGKHVSKGLKGGHGTKDAAKLARDAGAGKDDEPPPNINKFADKFARELNAILDGDRDERTDKLDQLVRWKSELYPETRQELASVLEEIGRRFTKYADRIKSGKASRPQVTNLITAQ